MTALRHAFTIITFAAILSDVTSWIVDIAEVEKLDSKEQFDEDNNYDEENYSDVATDNENEVTYTANYAENFNHETYKKKEVESVIKNGGVYLEGLSNAITSYRDTLDGCSQRVEPQNSSRITTQKPNLEELTKCEKAEKRKYYVQKLSEMALLTTDKMKDKAYENTNQEADSDEADLIQLAWTLDRLAYLTGYGSKQGSHVETSSTDNISGESPTIIPEETENIPNKQETQNSNNKHPATLDVKAQQLEILEQVENGRPLSRRPPSRMTGVKSVQKRDTADVMMYYLKHKVWDGSNPLGDPEINDNSEFDVQNSLKVLPIKKRSLEDKKSVHMQSAMNNIRKQRCKMNKRSKTPVRKLVKSIKVYRRKIFKNNMNVSLT